MECDVKADDKFCVNIAYKNEEDEKFYVNIQENSLIVPFSVLKIR